MRCFGVCVAFGGFVVLASACGGDNSPSLTTDLSGPGNASPAADPGDGSASPTDGGGPGGTSDETGETGGGGPPGCDGESPSISPREPSADCLPDVPCVSDANCPDGHACNTALAPPACALLFCGLEGTPCHDASVCGAGLQCHDGRCNPCTFCGDLCEVDFQTDLGHCGCCDRPVPQGGVCQGGEPGCPAGQTECEGVCVDLEVDPQHCGACGAAVDAGLDCVGGQPGCLSDEFSDMAMCDGQCVDLLSDDDNCTACGASCTFGSCTQYGLCIVDISEDEMPGVLPRSCKGICEAAGLTCYEDDAVGYAWYSGWCDSTEEYLSDCTDVPPEESYNGDYCGGSCTCALGGQRCYCLPKPP